MHLFDPRHLRPKTTDDALLVWLFVAAILLGLFVVLVVGHPLDVTP